MKIILIIVVMLLLAPPILADDAKSNESVFVKGEFPGDFVPQPRLLKPDTEIVDLTGQPTLNFSWSPHEGDLMQRAYYDFRIYKDYDMLGSNLIFNKEVPPNTYSIDVSSDMFKSDKVYTWSVRQVYINSGKSYRSYSSFKVK